MPFKDLAVRRQKNKEYNKKYYEANKTKIKKNNAQAKRVNRAEWRKFKSTFKCIHCGFAHPAAIDFHHVDRTNYRSVTDLVKNGNFSAAKREVQKCVALCANCHRIHHHEERLHIKKAKKRRKAKKKTPTYEAGAKRDVLNPRQGTEVQTKE